MKAMTRKSSSSALSAHKNSLENSKWQVSTSCIAGYPQLPLAMRKLTKILKLEVQRSYLAVQNSGSAIDERKFCSLEVYTTPKS